MADQLAGHSDQVVQQPFAAPSSASSSTLPQSTLPSAPQHAAEAPGPAQLHLAAADGLADLTTSAAEAFMTLTTTTARQCASLLPGLAALLCSTLKCEGQGLR